MTDGHTDGCIQAAFADVVHEALSIFALPAARFELQLRVRRARPATARSRLARIDTMIPCPAPVIGLHRARLALYGEVSAGGGGFRGEAGVRVGKAYVEITHSGQTRIGVRLEF